jgi:phosphate acetyltransferase
MNTSPASPFAPGTGFARLWQRAAALPAVRCAIVQPTDHDALMGPLKAARHGLITPVLIGPIDEIRATAKAHAASLDGLRLIDAPDRVAAAATAVALVRTGEADALMKGNLHTDELMSAVVDGANGLRTARRISHVFVLDVPTYERLLYVTDAAVNIAPDLAAKADILRNAIALAHALGLAQPRVAVMAAVETVNAKMQATLDAAALCKMAERGQITGALIDGPLAFDNAVNVEAANTKHIVSPVAGRADILLMPGIEAANMVAKALHYLGNAGSAGIVLGARVPIALTSRSDSVSARLASTLVLKLAAYAERLLGTAA